MEPTHRIGAVHALTNSIEPTQAAFDAHWPGAAVAHLMDGSLYLDRSAGTADEAELAARIDRLIRHSAATGAAGILFTGSFFGDAVRAARGSVAVPVLASFDGLVEQALALGRPLHVLSTARDSVTLLVQELTQTADARGVEVTADGHAVDGALGALLEGAPERHDALLLEAVEGLDPEVAVIFAQFSMERALASCAAATSAPVLGPATAGVAHLRRLLGA